MQMKLMMPERATLNNIEVQIAGCGCFEAFNAVSTARLDGVPLPSPTVRALAVVVSCRTKFCSAVFAVRHPS